MITSQSSVEWPQLFKFAFVICSIINIGIDCTSCTSGFTENILDNEEPTSVQDIFDAIHFDHGYYYFPSLNFQCKTRVTHIYGRFMVDLDVFNLVYFQIWSPADLRAKLVAELTLYFTADYSNCTQTFMYNITECLIGYQLPEDLLIEVDVGDFIGIYTFNNSLMRPFFYNFTGKHLELLFVMMSKHTQTILHLPMETDNFVDLSNEQFSPQLVVAVDGNYTTPVESTTNSNSESIVIMSVTLGIFLLISTTVIMTCTLVVCKIQHKKTDCKDNTLIVVMKRLMSNPCYGDSVNERLVNIHNQEHASLAIPLGFDEQLAPYLINHNNLHIEKSIAEGAFGIVYKGVCTRNGEAVDVAIKTIKNASTLKTEEFLKECNTAKLFNHPNIISFIGICMFPEEGTPLMVLPYMHNGDVKSFVKSKRGNKIEVNEFPEDLSYSVLTKICLDVAKGMEYLSSLHFIHRDLAARNCMLDHCMVAKVADFGLSRDIYVLDYYKLDHPALLPVKWLAPEALLDKCYTTKSDVWSFGVTCWEVFSLGLQPYPSVDPFEMATYLKSGRMLEKPPLSSAEMYKILQNCWNFAPNDRPTFSSLVMMMQQLNNENN